MCLIERMACDQLPEEVRVNSSPIVPSYFRLNFLVRLYCDCLLIQGSRCHFVVNENRMQMNNSDMAMQVQKVVDTEHSLENLMMADSMESIFCNLKFSFISKHF